MQSEITYEVEFLGEKTIKVSKGQSILEAALDAGIPHFHACGGKAKCSTCRIMVLDGLENLSKPNRKEQKLKDTVNLPQPVRLACQTFVENEPVKIDRIIRDDNDINAFLFADQSRPKKYKIQPLGEEKYLVLFFVDLRNFTKFIEAYLPFDIIYVTRKLFEIFTKAIKNNGGQVIETAGDQLFAIFGCDYSIREAADSAIRAGKELLDQLRAFNKAYSHLYLRREFEVGIGVHAAKVIVGKLNIAGELKTSVMGLGVNTASRVQDATKELNNSFLATDEVVRQSSYSGEFRTQAVNLRGITNTVVVHLLGSSYESVFDKPTF